ncbi:peptidase M14 [uncultured Cohaesibacter sp.]|uniref:peptidase M14 n=1 Tax=uncultured Cohaesibacter sp. TaxID=1002546 RepID=UPI00292FD870|nr:peptidase M14 [uncultured Cohaesibacter sp.]
MTLLLEQTFPRSVDVLRDRIAVKGDKSVELWLFDDRVSRQALEKALADKGVIARVRSSFKPLVTFFLEDVDIAGLATASITYPVHDAAPANRFLLEAYPLAEILKPADVHFVAAETGTDLFYIVDLTWKDGRKQSHRVLAPNHFHKDCIGEDALSPTGWIRWQDGSEEQFDTDIEQLFYAALSSVSDFDWGKDEPYFEELNITVLHPAKDEWLPMSPVDAIISLRESLHEDFYFSLLEIFQKVSDRPVGDRGLMPGQIVPEILEGSKDGCLWVRVETRPLTRSEAEAEDVAPVEALITPFTACRIRQELQTIAGEPFAATSRAGRIVSACYHKGSDRPVIISGGQHANEVTGAAGAMRAGLELAKRPNAHFTISPLENPDGYELGWRLRADNPHHMHHAARYTAFGCDLEYRPVDSPFETAIRFEAERLTDAKLHINLHGYPAHEWTRPFTGYVPRGFEMWTLPKGFFLIIRHHESWKKQAHSLIEQVTERLARNKALVDYNAQELALYTAHAGKPEWPVINGFPVMISVDDRHRVPITFITEYPDESIYGDDFIQGHTAQMTTALGAYDAWQSMEFPK